MGAIETTFVEMAIKQGIWAILFVWLFLKNMKQNDLREKNYQKVIGQNQKVIETFSKAFTGLSSDVHEIKNVLKIQVPPKEDVE